MRIPATMRRRGPNRSTSQPARKPNNGPTTSLLSAFPDVTWARDQPNSRTMKS